MASASLLEGLVWGRRAARHICAQLQPGTEELTEDGEGTGVYQVWRGEPETVDFHDHADIPAWSYAEVGAADPALISQDMSALQYIMWNYLELFGAGAYHRPLGACGTPTARTGK